MKKANLLLDNQSSGLTIIEKMDYELVDDVHGAMLFAFHPHELGDNDFLDDRFVALWTLFLASVGWTDDEFWTEYRSRTGHTCEKCAAKKDEQEKEEASETPDPKTTN